MPAMAVIAVRRARASRSSRPGIAAKEMAVNARVMASPSATRNALVRTQRIAPMAAVSSVPSAAVARAAVRHARRVNQA